MILADDPIQFELAPGVDLGFVPIPAGEFLMGSDPAVVINAGEDEMPQHRVHVSGFWMGKTPVTNQQYAVFVSEMGHPPPPGWENGRIPDGKDHHPVVEVRWDDAQAFCQWLNGRAAGKLPAGLLAQLPTEAEWEKAARGADGRIYPWGNESDLTRLNCRESGAADTTPVGRYSPRGDSPYGCADMAGNAWEWCSDWHNEEEYRSRSGRDVRDPGGPEEGVFLVLRGGSFNAPLNDARCSSRGGGYPGSFHFSGGFRAALSAARH